DHAGVPLGRYPGTLALEDRADALHWAVDPPESRADVREAVQRGDLRGGSWRMIVARDEWRGDVRHVHEIAELRDVSVVTTGAYPADAAPVELRSAPELTEPASEPEKETPVQVEDRNGPGLAVEDRTAARADH
ncbi:MAG: HK97 family phage prohead protease, partial [Actinomycetota bacterium]|nr:HK97 family phage prohead protease [Actinomycetota bacterium]